MLANLTNLVLKFGQLVGNTAAWEIKPSPIHGQGVFATRDFKNGETIGLLLKHIPSNIYIQFKRTLLGRYVNHQPEANAELVKNGDDYYLVCIKEVPVNTELVTDYAKYYDLMNDEQNESGKPVVVE